MGESRCRAIASARDRLGLALQVKRGHLRRVHGITNQLIRCFPKHDLTGASRLLEPCADIHRIADGDVSARPDRTLFQIRRRGEDLTRIDRRLGRQGHSPSGPELLVQRLQRLPHLHGGLHGAQRVIFVRARDTEHDDDRVADELRHCPSMPLGDAAHPIEVAVHKEGEHLGVQPLRERRGPNDVREDDGHGPTRPMPPGAG